ncbi:hypothetical protein SynBIOSE41_00921 [Synechococcus sp. BIOS-E4-1]|nr:hypothetical protein SynBIOSE41_00921 [Synechococcus sp. BIOS-E4-1]
MLVTMETLVIVSGILIPGQGAKYGRMSTGKSLFNSTAEIVLLRM